jgi:hypothetical protein
MKKHFIFMSVCLALISFTACNSSNTENESPVSENNAQNTGDEQARFTFGNNTSAEYEVLEHAFGKVFQNTDNVFVFKVKNTGKNPLVIERVDASCGCTVPEKPTEPIMPGATGEIPVIFHPGLSQEGKMSKTITVKANTQPKITRLRISAEVMKRF